MLAYDEAAFGIWEDIAVSANGTRQEATVGDDAGVARHVTLLGLCDPLTKAGVVEVQTLVGRIEPLLTVNRVGQQGAKSNGGVRGVRVSGQ